MVMCCVIPWCNKKVSKNLNGSMSNLCIAHNSMCTGMLRFQVRMKMYHKLYKWEKLFNGDLEYKLIGENEHVYIWSSI